jgi:hypothetical protein
VDGFDDRLGFAARQVHAAAAATARARQRGLRASAAGDATLVGILRDWAEWADAVVIETVDGRRITGPIASVGPDAIALVVSGLTYVPLAAICAVWPPRPAARLDASGHRGATGASFRSIVADLAAVRADVAVVAGGRAICGRIEAAGLDTMTIRLETGATLQVVIAQVSEVTVLASG